MAATLALIALLAGSYVLAWEWCRARSHPRYTGRRRAR